MNLDLKTLTVCTGLLQQCDGVTSLALIKIMQFGDTLSKLFYKSISPTPLEHAGPAELGGQQGGSRPPKFFRINIEVDCPRLKLLNVY